TVTGLYIGQALWQNYAVDLPLDTALNVIDGVEKVTWNNGRGINDTVEIKVILGNTANIKKTYEEITEKIEEVLKDEAYELAVKDNRTSELEQAYHDVHYYIQKAVVDGDFPLLSEKVDEKAAAAGASAEVYVDERNIYLQMSKDGSSLYSITARNSDRIGGDLR
ncbi:MAG TPA: hypothetical protein VN580_13300, partial [Clostridia bacterium]|nr:hypothetical protein [Clostridia bacterium]